MREAFDVGKSRLEPRVDLQHAFSAVLGAESFRNLRRVAERRSNAANRLEGVAHGPWRYHFTYMSTLARSGRPDDEELDTLRARAADLERRIGERSAEMAKAHADLASFRIRYRTEVGLLHEQLDDLERLPKRSSANWRGGSSAAPTIAPIHPPLRIASRRRGSPRTECAACFARSPGRSIRILPQTTRRGTVVIA